MNLFGMMDTSGGAMEAERMRAEVVAANMANAETTRTASGGPYHRQEVIFAANQGDPNFLDSMTAASGTAPGRRLRASRCRRSRAKRMWLRACISPESLKILHRRSNATIPDIPMPDQMAMCRIRTLIPSQRWWT